MNDNSSYDLVWIAVRLIANGIDFVLTVAGCVISWNMLSGIAFLGAATLAVILPHIVLHLTCWKQMREVVADLPLDKDELAERLDKIMTWNVRFQIWACQALFIFGIWHFA